MIKELNRKEFDIKLQESTKLLVVEFGAVWCKYCNMLNVELESLEPSDKYEIVKIDVDNDPILTNEYGVNVFPTLIFIRDGKEVHKIFGALKKADLLKELEKFNY